jgi:hypothetical protein
MRSSADFVLEPRELLLAPGASALVSVIANSERPGVLEDELRIALEDSAGEPLAIALHGRVEEVVAYRGPGDLRGGSGDPQRRSSAQGPNAADVPSGPGAMRGPSASGSQHPASPSTRTPGGDPATVAAPRSAGGAPIRATGEVDPARVIDVDGQRERAGALVLPYSPGSSSPIVDLSERPAPVPDKISAEEAERASPLPEQSPDVEGGEQETADDLADPDVDPFDDDDSRADRDDADADDDTEPEDPEPAQPILVISGSSSVTLLGTTARFYPQQVGVVGGGGGPFQLIEPIRFPMVPFAFGESMMLAQSGAVSGSFNALAGQVDLIVPMAAVDSDGDAAPMVVSLTTGTAVGRNDDGVVVSLTGSPRDPASGVLKLVALHPIPVGFQNGAEQHLVAIEVLAVLNFGT